MTGTAARSGTGAPEPRACACACACACTCACARARAETAAASPASTSADRRRSRRTGRGFTLVEVLVAFLVLAVMAAMAWRGVDGISRTRSMSEAEVNRTLRLQTTLAQLEQDLSAVETTQVIAEGLSCAGPSLRMTRRAENGMQLVVWALRGATLYRWASPAVTTVQDMQDYWLRSQQLIGNEGGQLGVLAGVADLQVYFYRGNAWSNCASTGDVVSVAGAAASAPEGGAPAAGVPAAVALPQGVRVVIAFNADSGYNGVVTRDIRMAPSGS